MAPKEVTLKEVGDILTHVVKYMSTKEDVADLKTEMMDQFDHVDARFREADGRLRDLAAEIASIHRSIDRLEEQGASNAGFAKEIDLASASPQSNSTTAFNRKHA
jgi:hypothetical protein